MTVPLPTPSVRDANDRLNAELLALLPPDAGRVVEVGCGSGALGAAYKGINPDGQYIGIERHPDLAGRATGRLDRVVTSDIETVDAAALGIEEGSVDCLVYSDVLEELADPVAVLRGQSAWLRPGGLVIASLRNAAHWTVLARLLQGRPIDSKLGPQDPLPQRFLSRENMPQLFLQAGLSLLDSRARVVPDPAYEPFRNLVAPVAAALGRDLAAFDRDAQALQYIFRAVHGPLPATRLGIHAVIGDPLIAARVRVWEPHGFLATLPDVRTTSSEGSLDLNRIPPAEERVLVLQRILTPREKLPLMRETVRRGYLLVCDIDHGPEHWPQDEAAWSLALRCCHAIQVPTEPLAEFVRRYNPHVVVFPNQLASLPPPRVYTDEEPVTVFFGAFTRDKEGQELLPALNQVLAEHGERLRVQVVMDHAFFGGLQTRAKAFEPLCPFERYAQLLRASDMAILPLRPSEFNRIKSDLKFLECAAYGVVALASPTVYEASIVDGETGFVCRSPEEFAQRLRQVIEDRNLRRQVAGNAYAWVGQHRLLGQHYRTRYDWYRQMVARLPELNQELTTRCPELFA